MENVSNWYHSFKSIHSNTLPYKQSYAFYDYGYRQKLHIVQNHWLLKMKYSIII